MENKNQKTTKIILYVAILFGLSFVMVMPVAAHAQQAPGEDEPIHAPVAVIDIDALTPEEKDQRYDEIMAFLDHIITQDRDMYRVSVDNVVRHPSGNNDTVGLFSVCQNGSQLDWCGIQHDNSTISAMVAEISKIYSPTPVKELSLEEQKIIDDARAKLYTQGPLANPNAVGIPIICHGVDPPTGKLRICLDVDKVESDSEQRLREIVGDVPLIIVYKKHTWDYSNRLASARG